MGVKLSPWELERYVRQLQVRDWGEKGQLRLKGAQVLVAGGGGLGCPAALYLVAAGVGHVAVLDKDTVELSNLNRQTLHWSDDLGKLKSCSAVEKLCRVNPEVTVEAIPETATGENVQRLVNRFTVVIDCMDNWQTRFMLNQACVKRTIPFIHAGVHSLYGQITTILPGKGPCLRCILPKTPKEEESVPIVGATAGALGVLEALEAIKIITGVGEPLVGRMLYFDGENMSFQEIAVERRADCPVCSPL